MKRKNLIKMSDREFIKSIEQVTNTETDEGNLVTFNVPLYTGYGFTISNIYWFLYSSLSDDIKAARVVKQKDEHDNITICQYFKVDEVDVYCLIREDIDYESTQGRIVLCGNEKEVGAYQALITNVVSYIIEKTECDY